MTDAARLADRAARLRARLDRLGRAAAAVGAAAPTAARAERSGVAVEVDLAGTVRRVSLAPGWPEQTPPHLLGRRVCVVLEEAWAAQLPLSSVGAAEAPSAPAPGRSTRRAAADLERARERLHRLLDETAAAPAGAAGVAAVEPRRWASAVVRGCHDGRVSIEVDPVWASDAPREEIATELAAALRHLTAPDSEEVA